MNKLATQLNATLGAAADFLSPAGKRIYFPYGGILGQGKAAQKHQRHQESKQLLHQGFLLDG